MSDILQRNKMGLLGASLVATGMWYGNGWIIACGLFCLFIWACD